MDVRALRYFTHIARAGSFNRAAAHLHIAQPALSRQLKKLEDELRVELFVRNGRGVELTRHGSLLLARAETLLAQFEETAAFVSNSEGAYVGRIRIGAPPLCGSLVAAQLFETFRARWPHAALAMREGGNGALEEWVFDRRLDLAIVHDPAAIEGIEIDPVLEEEMVLVGQGGVESGRAPQDPVTIEDLAKIPLIVPALPHGHRRLLERAATRHGLRLNIAAEVDGTRMIQTLVRSGVGQAVQTRLSLAADLVARTIDRPSLISTLCIIRASDTRTNGLVLEAAGLLRSIMGALVARGQWPGARLPRSA